MFRLLAMACAVLLLTAGSCPSGQAKTDKLVTSNYVTNISELYSDGKLPTYVDIIAGLDPTESADPTFLALLETLEGGHVQNHNVALVEPPGIDANARLWALAARINKGPVNERLRGKQVLHINLEAIKNDLRSMKLSSDDYLAFIQRVLNEFGDQIYFVGNTDDVAYQEDQYGVLVRFTREMGLKPEDLVKVFVNDKSDCVFAVSQQAYTAQFIAGETRSSIEKVVAQPYTASALFTYLEAAVKHMPGNISRVAVEDVAKATRGLFAANLLGFGTQILAEMGQPSGPASTEGAQPRVAVGDAAVYAAVAQVSQRSVGNIAALFAQMFDEDSLDEVEANVDLDPQYYTSFPHQNKLLETVSRELGGMRQVVVSNTQQVNSGIAAVASSQAEALKPVLQAVMGLAQQVTNLQSSVDNVATNQQVKDVADQIAAVLAQVKALPDGAAMAAAVAGENAKQTHEFQGKLQSVLDAVILAIAGLEGKIGAAASGAAGGVAGAATDLGQALKDLREQQAQLKIAIAAFSTPIAAELARVQTALQGQVGALGADLQARLQAVLAGALSGLEANLQHQILLTQTTLLGGLGSLNEAVRKQVAELQADLLAHIGKAKAQSAEFGIVVTTQQTLLTQLTSLNQRMQTEVLDAQKAFVDAFAAQLQQQKNATSRAILEAMQDVQTRLLQRARELGQAADAAQQDAFGEIARLQQDVLAHMTTVTAQQKQDFLARLQEIYHAFDEESKAQDVHLKGLLQQMGQRAQADLADILAKLSQQKTDIDGVLTALRQQITTLQGLSPQMQTQFTQMNRDIQTAAQQWGTNNTALQAQLASEKQLIADWTQLNHDARQALLGMQAAMAALIAQTAQTQGNLNMGLTQLQQTQQQLLAQIGTYDQQVRNAIATQMGHILGQITQLANSVSPQVMAVFAQQQSDLLGVLQQMKTTNEAQVRQLLDAQQYLMSAFQQGMQHHTDEIARLLQTALRQNEAAIAGLQAGVQTATGHVQDAIAGRLNAFQAATLQLIQQLQHGGTGEIDAARQRLEQALRQLNQQIGGVEGATTRLAQIVGELNAQIAAISQDIPTLRDALQGVQRQVEALAATMGRAAGEGGGLSEDVRRIMQTQQQLLRTIQQLTGEGGPLSPRSGGDPATVGQAASIIGTQSQILTIVRLLQQDSTENKTQVARILEQQQTMLEQLALLPGQVAAAIGPQLVDVQGNYARILTTLEEHRHSTAEATQTLLQRQQESFTAKIEQAIQRIIAAHTEVIKGEQADLLAQLTQQQAQFQTVVQETIRTGLDGVKTEFLQRLTQVEQLFEGAMELLADLATQQGELMKLVGQLQTTFLESVKEAAHQGGYEGALKGCEEACGQYYARIDVLIQALPANIAAQMRDYIQQLHAATATAATAGTPGKADADTSTGSDGESDQTLIVMQQVRRMLEQDCPQIQATGAYQLATFFSAHPAFNKEIQPNDSQASTMLEALQKADPAIPNSQAASNPRLDSHEVRLRGDAFWLAVREHLGFREATITIQQLQQCHGYIKNLRKKQLDALKTIAGVSS